MPERDHDPAPFRDGILEAAETLLLGPGSKFVAGRAEPVLHDHGRGEATDTCTGIDALDQALHPVKCRRSKNIGDLADGLLRHEIGYAQMQYGSYSTVTSCTLSAIGAR